MIKVIADNHIFFRFVGLLEYEGGKKWMADYHGLDCFFVVADCSHHGYVSTSSNKFVAVSFYSYTVSKLRKTKLFVFSL